MRHIGVVGKQMLCDAAVEAVSLSHGDTVVLPGGMGGVESIEGSEAAMALVRQAAEDTAATGDILRVYNEEKVLFDSYPLVIFGDVNDKLNF